MRRNQPREEQERAEGPEKREPGECLVQEAKEREGQRVRDRPAQCGHSDGDWKVRLNWAKMFQRLGLEQLQGHGTQNQCSYPHQKKY